MTKYGTDRVIGERTSGATVDIAAETFWAKSYSGRGKSASIIAIRWATLLFCLGVWGLVVAGIAASLS